MRRRPYHATLQVLLIISLLGSAVLLAWSSLRVVDFGYPLLYAALDIDRHIARFGPKNRFKQDFGNTSRNEHHALFAGIVDAVHAKGSGLAELHYRDRDGTPVALLRDPERKHLRSVARLIETLRWPAYALAGLLAATLITMRLAGVPPPRSARVLLWSAAVMLIIAAGVLAYGAEKAFYAAHEWIFPAGEQWYFYYQESLMTTLMKAPDLFGGIALLLVAAAALWLALLSLGTRRFLSTHRPPEPA